MPVCKYVCIYMNDSLDSLSWMVNRVQLYFLSWSICFYRSLKMCMTVCFMPNHLMRPLKYTQPVVIEKQNLKEKVSKQVYSVPVMQKREKKKKT